MDQEDRVIVERRGAVLIVTINRPEARNAFDGRSAIAFSEAMDLLDNEDGLFVGIVTGAGGNFCAGADLKAVARGERIATDTRGIVGLFATPPRKPLIAAVEGFAVGGGFEICLCCDLIVAAADARFGLPEVRHNVVALGGGLFRLPRRIPYSIAAELALTGQFKDAEFFRAIGFVNRVAPPGGALETALALAEQMLVNGPTALVATKEVMRRSADWTDEESWERQKPFVAIAMGSDDRIEGLAAFAEKRKPVWKGR